MHHRRKQRYTFLSEELIDTLAERQDERDADQRRQSQQRQEALSECVAKLSTADRTLLAQRYADPSTTIQSLASRTGQNANALYKTLTRVRRQLLECIQRRVAAMD